MTTFRLAFVLAAVAPLAAQGAPKFTTGDVGALETRVVGVRPVDGALQVLSVEVTNKGASAAEPLQFRVELPAKKPDPPQVAIFERAQLPHVARYGRPVPAGGKQTYFVPTLLPGKKGQFAVRVVAASFVEDGAVARPAVKMGKPEQVQRESLAGTFPVTQVAMTNPLDLPIDVLMLVTFEQPKDRIDLVGVRLEARATQNVVFARIPGPDAYIDPTMDAPGRAMKATAFEVVDWCLVGSQPEGSIADRLRPAYDAWYRWPEAEAAVGGDFVFREQRLRLDRQGTFDDFLIKGRFTVSAAGDTKVEMLEGKGANASFLIRAAIANVRRPDFATLTKDNRLGLVTDDRISLLGPGWNTMERDRGSHSSGGAVKAEECPDLQVRGERIVGDGMGGGERTAWEWQTIDGRAVVVRRVAPHLDTRFSYAVVDGRVVPTGVSQRNTPGGTLVAASELSLSNLRFEGIAPIPPQLPTGPGAAALRALWDAAFRLPTQPIVIEAKFAITMGNDGVWRGRKKLSGSIVMTGIGRNLRASDITFDGGLAREDQIEFGALLRDRLLMWYGSDFNDRAPFDEFFARATIGAPEADGSFVIDGCQYDRVHTSGGLVRGMRGKGGAGGVKYTWSKVADRQVVTRIDAAIGGPETPAAMRWEATTTVVLAPVGEYLLPAKISFEHAFGRDWEPETIVFKDVRVRDR